MKLAPTHIAALLCCIAALKPMLSAQTANHTLLEKPLEELLRDGHFKVTGDLPITQTLSLNLSLPLRNEDQLDKFLQEVSDPTNSNYRHYMTSEQFIAQYAPAQHDYDLLIRWAKDTGLSVTETPANRNYVAVQGSVATIRSAFHVSLKSYVDLTTGRSFFAPDQEPAPITPVPLLAITGLDTITPKVHFSSPGAKPISNAGGSGPGGTFTPTNIRTAYYPQGTLTGTGQAVAIFSYNGYLTSDLNLYYQQLGISQPVFVSNVLVNGYSGACTSVGSNGTSCYDLEPIIDIAAVAGMAPGLNAIFLYEGTSSTNILNRMVSDNYAMVISSSWAGGDFGTSSESIFKQMQAQGITYFNASGDNGAYQSTPLPPSLSPSITQVGGTTLTTNGAGGSYSSEIGWFRSGGGWIANTFSIPSFQQSAITAANAGSTSWRNSPDVSAEGDYDNLSVSNGVVSTNTGGTSFAAPRWAGLVALVNQQAVANCESSAGFILPTLYATLNTANYTNDFHDVTSGNNRYTGSIGYNAVSNYDLVTGLGSPTGQNLVNLLAPVHSSATSTSISQSHTSGSPTTFSAHLSASGGAVVNSGTVSFSYSLNGSTTQACSASVIGNNASCTANVNDQTNQYTLTASYSGTTSQYPKGCAASSTSTTAIGTGYGFN